MAGSRTLKLSILAETADLVKGLNSASQETQTFGDKVEAGFSKVGKAAAIAGAAIAVMAGKLAVDGVKAALEDEAAQAKLAATLQNVTGATEAQIASVEDYIYQTSIAVGVTDDELRPSFERLFRSVKDVDEVIRLQSLALDISAGTGRNLSSVTEALAKAYDGNFGALKRLGAGIDESIIKNKDFDGAVVSLSKTFSGQADVAANTYAGRVERLKIAFNEAKETIGSALLPQLGRLTDVILKEGVPAFDAFVKGLTGDNSLKSAIGETSPKVVEMRTQLTSTEKIAKELGETVRLIGSRFADLFAIFDTATGGEGSAVQGLEKALEALNTVAKITAKVFEVIEVTVEGIVEGFRDIIRYGNQAKQFFSNINPFSARQSSFDVPVAPAPTTSNLGTAQGGANYITVNGAIDPEGTARTIINVLNNSQSRGTLGAGALAF
jgi:hypothetical protein